MEKFQAMALLQDPAQLSLKLWNFIKNSLLSWRAWWKNLSIFQKIFPAASVFLYWTTLSQLHGLKQDHLVTGSFLLFLSYTGRLGRIALRFALPFLLTAIVYDSQRFYADYIRGPIHVSEPYLFDKTFFGIPTAVGVLTPNEWCQLHIHPLLDLITGFAYLVFITVFILISAFFLFYLGKKGTSKMPAAELKERAELMPWAFFWLNVLGYTTYYWYAAAPPWYVSLYGLGPAKMDVNASSAGCVRFDQILGTHFFSEMYGRSADVFGAIPSLHVSYPLLAVYYAFRFGSSQVFCICFYLIMCFSAVYLNHHYILDILWGSFYALLIGVLFDRFYAYNAKKLAS